MKRVHLFIAFALVAMLVAAAPLSQASTEETAKEIAAEGSEAAQHYEETTGEAMDAMAEEAMNGHDPQGEAAHGEHGLPWGNYIFRIVNFIIFLGLIWYFAGKKIVAFIKGRPEQIRQDLDDLEARKKDAEAKLEDVRRRIANLESERASIVEEAKQQGETLKAAIIEKAEKDAEQICANAKRTAENEARNAMNELRAEMADLVVDEATKIVREKLTEQDHEKLVDEYLTKVVLN